MLRDRRLISLGALFLLPGSSGAQTSAPLEVLSPAPRTARLVEVGAPDLVIGSMMGDEPYVFSQVHDATMMPGGSIAVVDSPSLEIRIFDSNGQHLRTFGGEGDGPAEFNGTPMIAASGDSLLAWDQGRHRLTSFDINGNLRFERSLARVLGQARVRGPRNGITWQLHPAGLLLFTGSARDFRRPESGLRERERRMVLVDPESGAVTDYGTFPAGASYWLERAPNSFLGVRDPFAPVTQGTFSPTGGVAIAGTGRWEVNVRSPSGNVEARWEISVGQLPMNRETVRSLREGAERESEVTGIPRREIREVVASLSRPDSLQAIGTVLVDTTDRLWVGRTLPGEYRSELLDVLSSEGTWLFSVRIPPEITRILEIGPDYILAQVLDELEIQYLAVYRFQAPGPS